MENDEYLKNTRKSGLNIEGTTSEAELINTQDSIADAWADLMAIKKKIADAKLAALKEIDEQYREELKDAESTYAMLLTVSR
jgi:hypothetical protein